MMIPSREATAKHMVQRRRIILGLAAEVVFTLLPLLIVLIVSIHKAHSFRFLASTEWSVGAAILFGQSFVKLMVGVARRGKAAQGPIAFVTALLLVFGLVPSMIVLILILDSLDGPTGVSLLLTILQVILFCLGVVTYILLGTVGEEWGERVDPL